MMTDGFADTSRICDEEGIKSPALMMRLTSVLPGQQVIRNDGGGPSILYIHSGRQISPMKRPLRVSFGHFKLSVINPVKTVNLNRSMKSLPSTPNLMERQRIWQGNYN